MQKTTQCPACHKLVSIDAETCPHCGHPRPENGWAPSKRNVASRIIGAIILIAVAIWIVIFLLGSGHSTASARWAPTIGQPALLQKAAVACPDRKVLDTMANQVAQAKLANDEVGGKNAIFRAVLEGCVIAQSPQVVKVIDIKNLGIGATGFDVRVRAKNAIAYWVWSTRLETPQRSLGTN